MSHTKGKIEYTVEVKKGWRILLIDNHKRDILHGYSKDFAESNAKELCHRWNECPTLKQQRDDLLEAMTSTQNILEDIHFRHSNKKSFHNNRIAADSSTGIEILKAVISTCEA